MKIRIAVFCYWVLIILINYSIEGQNLYDYNSFSNQALKKAIIDKDTLGAIKLFNKEIKKYGFVHNYQAFLHFLFQKSKYKQFAKEYLRVIENAGFEEKHLDSYIYNDTNGFYKSINKIHFKKKMTQSRAKFLQTKNIDYIVQIGQQEVRDQYPRRIDPEWFNKDSVTNYEIFWKIMAKQDSMTIIEMKMLFNKYGPPNRSQVGNISQFYIIVGLMHACAYYYKEHYKFFEEYFRKMLRNKELEPELFALFVDYTNAHAKGEQIYGWYPDIEKMSKGIRTYWKIKDIENVDIRRKEIGLIEIKYDAIDRRWVLPAGYNFKE